MATDDSFATISAEIREAVVRAPEGLDELREDGHFYGAWHGGSKAEGGGPGKAGGGGGKASGGNEANKAYAKGKPDSQYATHGGTLATPEDFARDPVAAQAKADKAAAAWRAEHGSAPNIGPQAVGGAKPDALGRSNEQVRHDLMTGKDTLLPPAAARMSGLRTQNELDATTSKMFGTGSKPVGSPPKAARLDERLTSKDPLVRQQAEFQYATMMKRDTWVAGAGGTEMPYNKGDRRIQRVFNPKTGMHGYLDLGTDMVHPDNDLPDWLK